MSVSSPVSCRELARKTEEDPAVVSVRLNEQVRQIVQEDGNLQMKKCRPCGKIIESIPPLSRFQKSPDISRRIINYARYYSHLYILALIPDTQVKYFLNDLTGQGNGFFQGKYIK
jgi:hypothetical protein